MKPLKFIKCFTLNLYLQVQQFLRDVEDEKMWMQEKMPQATGTDYGNSLLSVQMLQTKNQSLQNEIDSHEPRLGSVCDTGRGLIDEGHPQAEEFQDKIDDLNDRWRELFAALQARKERLQLSEIAQQVNSTFLGVKTILKRRVERYSKQDIF